MKTTVDIADPLFRQAKAAAEESGATMRQLIEDGLRTVLDKRKIARKKFRLGKLPTQGGGLRTDFEHADWHQILDESYLGRGA
jgi:hypothetical protein